MTLARYAAIRLAATIAVGLVVSIAIFASVELLPGDAATAILGQNATPERLELVREQLRLDDGPVERYLSWLGGVVQGDLGTSVVTQRPVTSVIETPIRNSVILGAIAFGGMAIIAVTLGAVAGRRPGGRADRIVSTVAAGLVAVPDFVLGGVLIAVFASWLDLFPSVSLVPVGASPLDDPMALVLPAATLALFGGAFGARLIRAVVVDASSSPHVEAAELAGLPEWRVITRHLLPPIVAPIVQVLASLAPYAVGGTIVVERLFGYPGVGAALIDQLAARDVTVVEAIGLLLTVVVLTSLFVADVIGAAADPRRRRAGGPDETDELVPTLVAESR